MDIGLIVFIAVVGMHAGPHAVEAYHASGGAFFASIFVAGMIVTVVPLAVGTIAARYVLKMSPLMTLGGLAGAQTCTPGLERAARGQRQQRRLARLHRARTPSATSCSRSGDRSSSPSCTRCERQPIMKRGFDVLRDKSLNRSIAFDRAGARSARPDADCCRTASRPRRRWSTG